MKQISLLFAVAFTLLTALPAVRAQESMTAGRFRKIVSTPGDNTPIDPHLLVAGPLWTNATITVDLTYANGQTSNEKDSATLKTVEGKYIVCSVQSHLYKQTMNAIIAYDEKAGSYKIWGLNGEMVTEGWMVYDTEKKIYSSYSEYGDFTELGVSSYSNTESSSHTLVLKNGVLFCTRDEKAVPVKPSK